MPVSPIRVALSLTPDSSSATADVAAEIVASFGRLGIDVVDGGLGLGLAGDAEPIVGLSVVGPGRAGLPPVLTPLSRSIVLITALPGSSGFERGLRLAAQARACFAVSEHGLARLRAAGIDAELFMLGYRSTWDGTGLAEAGSARTLDVSYLGANDRRHLELLARLTPELADGRSRLLLSRHAEDGPLRGGARRALLADTRLLLSPHRYGDGSIDLAHVIQAMCNGTVVLAERGVDLGGFTAGEHLLSSAVRYMGPALRAALADSDSLAELGQRARAACRARDMAGSIEQLAAVARRLAEAPVRPAESVELGPLPCGPRDWRAQFPQPPTAEHLHSPRLVRAGRLLTEARRHLPPLVVGERVPNTLGALVDVICVRHDGSGPLTLTVDSLTAQPSVNVLVASIGPSKPTATGCAVHIACPEGTSISAARNALLAAGRAPYVFVVDSGDELMPGVIEDLRLVLESTGAATAYAITAYGSETLTNLARRGSDRLRSGELSRGYLVRRTFLEDLGGFEDDPATEAQVDDRFWKRALSDGGLAHLPSIGVRLWPTSPARLPIAV